VLGSARPGPAASVLLARKHRQKIAAVAANLQRKHKSISRNGRNKIDLAAKMLKQIFHLIRRSCFC
jgi:hypothetical protein